MKNWLKWLITSSANPQALGLTVRGLLAGVATAAAWLLPTLCSLASVCVDVALVNPVIDAIVQIIVAIATVISAGMVLVGLLRKISIGRWSAHEE